MDVIATKIPDVLLFKPKVFGDERGFFMETFRQSWFEERDIKVNFVQDNHSSSARGVLRGLHYQIKNPQGKLVRVTAGEVFDVAVDLRKSSPTFGQSVGVYLSAENKNIFWVPPGFAHGFLVLSELAEFNYKCTEYYAPEHDRSLLWNDPALKIDWPLGDIKVPVLSAKDQAALSLAQAETFA
ncbi:dTDP-4-dehydrorhamnose 3,5-epimerase [Cellvibrio sp. OA-2007]|uniref:dTDP-4-dehydrorhamnose 3,5-epimerase n=1 Tax=Cellvibrio sp. OA-2007 TaxID=529823 RepID=UPI000785035B|nr:dTDP-4-dehydrorhamnose 3,5-epimerase [Cellvibrio sp. OA-2007]